MLVTDLERQRDFIKGLADLSGHNRNALIPLLQSIQHKYHHVSEYAMQVVADELNIHPVEVYSVVSFYSFLDSKPKGRFVIRLCNSVTCEIAGKDKLARQLESELGISFGETTKDGLFSLEWTSCIGMCDQGPALLVNHEVHTRVKPDQVIDIIENCESQFEMTVHQEEH